MIENPNTGEKMHRLILTFLIFIQCMSLTAYEKEVSIAAIFRDDARYLKEWIDYHRLVGVQYFWLYNDMSQDDYREVLRPYVEEGIVEVIDWSEQRARIKTWPETQIEAYRHAIAHAKGKTRWLALIDTDEFILPMKNDSIQECLTDYFSDAQAIYIQWLVFGTSGVTLSNGQSMLRELTFCSDNEHPWSRVGKSIVQPEHILTDKIWYNHHFPIDEFSCYKSGSANQIPMINHDLFGPVHQSSYLRINHYFFRDEKFYQEVKIQRKLARGMSIEELTSLHNYCFKNQDFAIIDLLNRKARQLEE